MDADRLPITTLPEEHVAPSSRSRSSNEEKPIEYDAEKEKLPQDYQQTTLDIESVDDEYVIGDPLPLDSSIPEEPTQFTLRAVLM